MCIGRLRHRHILSVHEVLDDVAGSSCIAVSDYCPGALSLDQYCRLCIDTCEPPPPAVVEDLHYQLVALAKYITVNVPEIWHHAFFTEMFRMRNIWITGLGEVALGLCFYDSFRLFQKDDMVFLAKSTAHYPPIFADIGVETDMAPKDVATPGLFSREAVSWIVSAITFIVSLSGPFPEVYSPDRRENYIALASFTKLNRGFVNEICLAMEHSRDLRTRFSELIDSEFMHSSRTRFFLRRGWERFLEKGRSYLMIAACERDVPTIRLHRRISSGLENETGRTALMMAIAYNNQDIIQLLAPCEGGHTDIHGNCATEQALLSGNVDLARLLVPFERIALSFAGYTELMLCIIRHSNNTTSIDDKEREATLRALIDQHKFRVTRQNMTALMVAAIVGDMLALHMLIPIESGIRDLNGLAAINYAVKFNNQKVYEALRPLETISDDSGNTPLHELAYHNRHEILKYFHQFIGKLNNQGMSALMLAARCNNIESVQYLAEHEAGMRMQSKAFYGLSFENATAMMIAAYYGYEEVVSVLLPYEGQFRDTHSFKTALMAASMGGHPAVVRCLLNTEGRMVNKSGYTALMLAAMHNKLECVLILAAKEANMQSKTGELAVELALKKGYTEIVDALLPYEQLTAAQIEKYMLSKSQSQDQNVE